MACWKKSWVITLLAACLLVLAWNMRQIWSISTATVVMGEYYNYFRSWIERIFDCQSCLLLHTGSNTRVMISSIDSIWTSTDWQAKSLVIHYKFTVICKIMYLNECWPFFMSWTPDTQLSSTWNLISMCCLYIRTVTVKTPFFSRFQPLLPVM